MQNVFLKNFLLDRRFSRLLMFSFSMIFLIKNSLAELPKSGLKNKYKILKKTWGVSTCRLSHSQALALPLS